MGKGGKARKVPLWWDAGTLAFLQQFMARRIQEEAAGSSLLICSTSVQSFAEPLGSHESEPTLQAGDQGAWA